MTGTTETAREVDRVLRGLQGHDLFRRNAFRVTGLAPDATPRQVRRAKEESRNAYYLPPDATGAPLPPSTDPVELRAAFEVLQDPVARLVHELLWTGTAEQDVRAGSVRALCRALEGTSERGTVLTETAWKNWRKGLRSWAEAMRSEATWERARRRAAEIDDPRVTVGLVRTLRQRLQQHVVGVAAGIAVREARTSPGTAGRLVRDLRGAGFDTDDVTRTLRAAAQPLLDEVKTACRTARSGDPARAGVSAARTLLGTTRPPLQALGALLGKDDELARGGFDDVALTTNNCVVAYANEHAATLGADPADLDEVIGHLEEALALATQPRTTELVTKNVAEYREVQGIIRHLREATDAARRMRTASARAGGAGPARRAGPVRGSGPVSGSTRVGRPGPTRTPEPFTGPRGSVGLGMWGWLLLLGPGPAIGLGLGAAALGLPWFWGAAPALVAAFYVAYVQAWSWTYVRIEPHLWLLLLPAGAAALVTAWLGGFVDWVTFTALTVSILVATAKET